MNTTVYVFVLAALTVACSGPDSQIAGTQPNPAPRVTTILVGKTDSVCQLGYSGTIEAFQTIPVMFQTPGTVETVLVDEGMPVVRGQLLATLNKSDSQNMYLMNEAQYQQALDAYNRLKTVHDNGSLAEIKWVEMESNLKQAESSMNISKHNLEKTRLTSPTNGFVGKRNIEPGMGAISLNAPFEIVKIDQVYVRLSVPEREINAMKKGMKATFTVPALGDKHYVGEVTLVGVVADRFARTYEVKVLADNRDLALKPGMICDLKLDVSQRATAMVDYRAVTRDGDGQYVYKLDATRAFVTKQPVVTGHIGQHGIEIAEGLSVGDEVVCEGMEKIFHNSKVSL